MSLPDQIEREIAKVMADGAYDGAPTYETIAAHGDDIEVVIQPRSMAAPSGATCPPTQRDLHVANTVDWVGRRLLAMARFSADPGAGVAQPPSTRRAVLQKETV